MNGRLHGEFPPCYSGNQQCGAVHHNHSYNCRGAEELGDGDGEFSFPITIYIDADHRDCAGWLKGEMRCADTDVDPTYGKDRQDRSSIRPPGIAAATGSATHCFGAVGTGNETPYRELNGVALKSNSNFDCALTCFFNVSRLKILWLHHIVQGVLKIKDLIPYVFPQWSGSFQGTHSHEQ